MGSPIPVEEITRSIHTRCRNLDYTFSGFVEEYSGTNTKIVLTCNRHGTTWSTTRVCTFLKGTNGCTDCSSELTSKRSKMVWIGVKRSYRDSVHTIIKEDNKYIGYLCSICSSDTELYPSPFRLHKSDWAAGKCSCGCSKGMRRTKEQFEILCRRKAETIENISFLGFCDNKVRVSTKIILSCKEHGEWSTSSVEKFLSDKPRGCPSCALDRSSFGLYTDRLSEPDYIYMLKFINIENPLDTFIKVGRSFKPQERVRKFPKQYHITIISGLNYEHEDSYRIEQAIHEHCKDKHYTPLIPFGGSVTECFTCDILEDRLIRKVFGLKAGQEQLYAS